MSKLAKSGFKGPKTQASRRAVALHPVVVEELRNLRDLQRENMELLGPEYCDYGLVFCKANGKPVYVRNLIQRDFLPVIRRAGLPRIRFHDLRHVHASFLARAGVPPKVAQERLGHSTPGFSIKIYTHTLAGMQEAAARALQDLLLGRSQ